jgi:hypothetical protein
MANKREEVMARKSATQSPVPGKTISVAERNAIIDRIAGSLTSAEANELAQIIEECCEQIDEHG